MQNSPGIEPLRIASQVMQNSPREHGARATRGRGLVDRTTFPYEDLRDGATLPTGPGTLLAHGRGREVPIYAGAGTRIPRPTHVVPLHSFIRTSFATCSRATVSDEAV